MYYFNTALRIALTVSKGISRAAAQALLGESINEDFQWNYDSKVVMATCAVFGFAIEATLTYCFEAGFIRTTRTLTDEDEEPLTDAASERPEPENPNRSLCSKVVIGLCTTARFADISVSTLASYAACKGLVIGNQYENPLAALSIQEYLGVLVYTLIANGSFSFLTEIASQFNLQFHVNIPPTAEKLMRSLFTLTHIADHATDQTPLVGQGIKQQIGPLIGLGAAVAVANIPVGVTTYLFETREIAKRLSGQSHELALPTKLAQLLYTAAPGLSAMLHGAEGAMPVVLLLSEQLNLNLAIVIPPAILVAALIAVGNWYSEGKETREEIIKSVNVPDGMQIKSSCLFFGLTPSGDKSNEADPAIQA